MQMARSCTVERRCGDSFHCDHDISREKQLFELGLLSSVAHSVSSSLRVYLVVSLRVVLVTTVQLLSACSPATDCDLERV